MMIDSRTLASWVAALACVTVVCSPVSAAGKGSQVPSAPFDIATAIGDPMSPVNPYNAGTDPITMPGDARMAVFSYSRDQIYRIMTAPLKTTTIELARGEVLATEPALGDSIQWIVDTDGSNHVFIKPVKPGLVNTLHLTTNQREYDMTLVSSPMGGLFYQTVRFNYPGSLMAKVRAREDGNPDTTDAGQGGPNANGSGPLGVSPDKLNFDYTVSGSAPFRPETVFDDGKSVWLRLPANAPFAVPIVRDHGDNVSPNFIRRGQYIVVQEVPDEIVLRAATDQVTIRRGRPGIFGF
ncbi:TrbG/VirB9 family P-type conjugative transfer protein [Paraburkholderia atlantica]|uniref:Conjugal transfer protein TrbG/VirB9/CagX n=1 Tax=Paraburkholderia atlantica TaxID=2654982 RepID=D5WP05_PARAM|nr:TrbG/VirB9 family P-type conjugative transfer protein [Paraburkholderia atlantica]ADG20628.1 Conjugal transfer protein TrbG/VirB9/CagX [Paraburkholderia atlantica]MBB5510595.1 type IV secretion system protein VirB9 [Paraburkholderia atlantica]